MIPVPPGAMSVIYIVMQTPIRPQLTRPFEELLGSLHSARDWVIGAPELIDYIDEEPTGEKWTYGCALQMRSAFPPWRDTLPKEIDRRHYEEAALLIDRVTAFSLAQHCDFYVQFDSNSVGFIRDGVADDAIRLGLLEEWRNTLGSS
jgi:hypothetical protein